MGSSAIPSPDEISETTFAELLGRYGDVIQAVSDAKKAKPGQKTLAQLDEFRYGTSPAAFGSPSSRRTMTLDDVTTLVAWKLSHGKFRPTLMKLVGSNDPAAVEKTVKEALAKYEEALEKAKTSKVAADPKQLLAHATASGAAVRVLCRLRGIGPATASLLLAVHHPETTIFFSDEAYAWLCGGASHDPPRQYNDKEYGELARHTAELMCRLSSRFGAQSVEQVAYVLMNDKKGGQGAKAPKEAKIEKIEKKGGSKSGAKASLEKPVKERPAAASGIKAEEKPSAKRKEPPTDAAPAATGPVRRSNRLQRS